MNFLCFTLQLDPMNILFSYFTSINVFFMVKTRTPHPSFSPFSLYGIHKIMRIIEYTIRKQSMDSKFKLTYEFTKNKLSLFTCFICILSIPILLIHFTPKRLNTAIIHVQTDIPFKIRDSKKAKNGLSIWNKQVNTIFLIIHLSSSRKIENKNITVALNEVIIKV